MQYDLSRSLEWAGRSCVGSRHLTRAQLSHPFHLYCGLALPTPTLTMSQTSPHSNSLSLPFQSALVIDAVKRLSETIARARTFVENVSATPDTPAHSTNRDNSNEGKQISEEEGANLLATLQEISLTIADLPSAPALTKHQVRVLNLPVLPPLVHSHSPLFKSARN